jgi:hypothetical protein
LVVIFSPHYFRRTGLCNAAAEDVGDEGSGCASDAEAVSDFVDSEREDYKRCDAEEREPKLGGDESGSGFGANEDPALPPASAAAVSVIAVVALLRTGRTGLRNVCHGRSSFFALRPAPRVCPNRAIRNPCLARSDEDVTDAE